MNGTVKNISTIKNFMGNTGRTTCNEYLYGALQDAVESMEKQIPKKPVPYKGYEGKCACGAVFLDRGTNYCGNCGQALDWGTGIDGGEQKEVE